MYDPAIGRFSTMDPLAEKYYSISPYAYCANNPVKYLDPDGRVIQLFSITHTSKTTGSPVFERGVSEKTNAALQDYVKTDEGRAYLAQFAKAGQVIGDYKFTEDGVLSDHKLNIWDASYSKETSNITDIPGAGKHSVKIGEDGKAVVSVKVVSYGVDKAVVGETLAHEMQLHGYSDTNKIAGKTVTTGNQDHKAFRDKDSSHKGYKQYKSVQLQLEKMGEDYKKAFQKAQEDANKVYKNL